MKTKFYLLAALAAFICQQAFSQNKVGTLPGTAGVSPTGAATYTIPVWVSPGTNGMQPDLSIVYNSSGGNGPMGIGWGISGLSAITRTGKDWMHYGADKSGVDLTASDRYTLDGNLMLVTNGGAYNVAGTIYGTEMETFNKIEAFGIIYPTPGLNNYANCPEYFKVYRKDGAVLEYGNTTDSKVKVTGTNVPLKWQLSKITDANGNYMTYEYENNEEGYIKKINYTGSTLQPFTPYASVEFEYTDNTYGGKNIVYVGGKEINQKRRLTDIKINYGSAWLYKYHFNYTYSYFQHLFSIDYTNSNGESFNSTQIDWGVATGNFTSQTSLTNVYDDHKWFAGDYNGDGISDLISIIIKNSYGPNDQFNLYLFDRAGNATFNCSTLFNYNDLKIDWVRTGDVNNDGKDELIVDYFEANGSLIVAYTFNGTSFVVLADYQSPQSHGFELQTGDFDGDGKLDLYMVKIGSTNQSTPDWYAVHYIGNDFVDFMSGSIFANNITMYPGDYNGDGKTDVLYVYDDSNIDNFKCKIVDLIPSSYTVLYADPGFPTKNHAIYPGDYNGDGKTDLITWDPATNSSSLNYFNGAHFESPIPLGFGYFTANPQNDEEDNDMYVNDFNGDGKSDIMTIATNGTAATTTIWMYYFKGNNGNNQIPQYNMEVSTFPEVYTSSFGMVTGDFNGDGKADFFHHEFERNGFNTTNLAKLYTFHANEKTQLVQTIQNGLGKIDHFNYEPLTELATNTAIGSYSKGSGATFPVFDYIGALHVVNKTWETDANSTELNKTYYSYAGAKIHKQGRGFLCFASVTAKKTATSFATRNVYDYNTQHYYPYISNSYYDHAGSPTVNLKNTSYTNTTVSNAFGCYFNYPASQVSTDVETGVTITTNTAINANGNLTGKEIIGHTGGTHDYTTTITNTYLAAGNAGNGTPNKVFETTTQQQVFQPYDMFTVYKKYTYDNGTGNITKEEVTSNGNTSFTTSTDYLYDPLYKCGMYASVKQNGKEYTGGTMGTAMQARVTSYAYDAKCRFVEKTFNDLGQVTTQDYNYDKGTVFQSQALDAQGTRYWYDHFGRLEHLTDPRGVTASTTFAWCSSPTGAVYSVSTTTEDITSSHLPTATAYYDAFGRELLTTTQKFTGGTTVVTTGVAKEYQANTGRLHAVSIPFDVSGSTPSQRTLYDYRPDNGKLDKIQSPSGNSTSYTYTNNSVQTSTPIGYSSKIYNSLGQVTQSSDANGTMAYQYYAHGKLRHSGTDVTHVNMEYDDFAHQTKLIDPDAGEIHYEYNSFGELTHQEDAKGNTFEMQYNGIGQLTQKEANGGAGNAANGGFTTSYTYKPQGPNPPTTTNSIAAGKIEKIEKNDGALHTIEYIYNALGDVERYAQKGPGYNMDTKYNTYDAMGRVKEMMFPSGYTLLYDYSTNTGDMVSIRGKDGNNNPLMLWSNPVKNVFAQPVQFTYGDPANNLKKEYSYDATTHMPTEIKITDGTVNPLWRQQYEFDAGTGNLKKRVNMAAGGGASLTEIFDYKNNQQLEISTSTGSTFTICYGADGNITQKNDIGTYSYDHPTKTHAVTSILPTQGVKYTLPIFTQDVTYTAFNKASQITENDKVLDLTYGPDDERVYTKLTSNVSGNTQILYEKYFAPNFEHYADAVQTVGGKDVHYVQSPFGLAAVIVKESTNPYEINFIGTDYLGSITHVMEFNGTYKDQYSFDAWGRRRDRATWQVYDEGYPAPAPLKFARGYTGHEHLEEFGIINMNGRMYDAAMAKMLSPDNFNNAPFSTIGLNRYAYVYNNPLKYVDPSGNKGGWWVALAMAVIVPGSVETLGGMQLAQASTSWTSGFATRLLEGNNFNTSLREGDRRATNMWKIFEGTFTYDEHYSGWDDVPKDAWQIASRFTWQAPQTFLGYHYSAYRNDIGRVDNVEYYGGATLVNDNTDNLQDRWGATLGPFINTRNVPRANPYQDNLFRHEFGHTLQSGYYGPLYLPIVAVPSLMSSLFNIIGLHDHDRSWFETQANRLSFTYFNNEEPEVFDINRGGQPWNNGGEFPLEYNPDWFWLFAPPPFNFDRF